MTYNDTLNYLFTRLPMFQRTGPAAYKNTLDNTLQLDALYGNPHRKYKTIHVAGTNGKGSVSHMLASALQSAGYKTGLYTSPHLKDFRERIKINGEMIPEKAVADWVSKFKTNNTLWKIEPSFFELTVALAFDYFAAENVDVAVIEVGLGGRLDSTNIIAPEVSVITNIGLDHTNLLGVTLAQIAGEKAGIIKNNTPVVISETHPETAPVFLQTAEEKQAPLFFADHEYRVDYATRSLEHTQILHLAKGPEQVLKEVELDLLGSYQHKNLPAVLKAVDLLREKGFRISDDELRRGLVNVIAQTGLLGRWQIIGNNPLIVCDTGHNQNGIREVAAQLQNTAYRKLHVVFGTVADKNPDPVLALLPKNAQYYFVRAKIERALDEEVLRARAAEFGLPGECYKSVSEGFKKAREAAGKHDMIFVGGSTFVVAEIL